MSWHRLSRAIVNDLSLGGSQAFVYVIVAPVESGVVFYVGQTRQRMGALGRLAEHLSEGANATFRQRIWDVARSDVVGTIHFAAIALSGDRAFQQSSPDYREAVECLVEADLREYVVASELQALSVARVRQHAYRVSPIVQREARRSMAELQSWLRDAICSARSQASMTGPRNGTAASESSEAATST
jgi:hypothetical protein